MIASVLLALFVLFASWWDVPAPATPPPVVTVGDSPTTPHYAPPAPVDEPPLDPDHPELAMQLDAEASGGDRLG